ncbi:MAG: TadE/TadG family type IV pilus assembly protein [Chloroflexota bacterium]|nr:TadE/TadG family type IV pilus assembly protein [Chloroflexota bacterium]
MTKRHRKGQGLVEFALVMPIFLTLIMGIVEFSRLMIIYTGAATASREAARYGASVGLSSSGIEHYRDCAGIRDTAKRISGLAPIQDSDITIQYDNPSTGFFEASCPPSKFELGDRIVVQVHLSFDPIVPLINVPPIPISSETKRTVLRDIYIK